MVTPRPGWSRRAQYGLFFSFIAAIVGAVAGLALLLVSIASPSSFANLKGLALDATAPVNRAFHQVSTTVEGLASGAGNYWDAAHQNAQLRRERDAMRRHLIRARAILLENEQLKATLELRERSDEAVATGRIVGSSFQHPRRFATLSVGSRDGVEVAMPVRGADGLLGRVIDVGAFASRVLLISDRSSIVPARHLRSGQAVISQGRGDGTVELKPIEVGRNPFTRGDIVVTSGTGGLYPPLIPVARVVRTLGDNAIAIPLADPGEVNFAVVLRAYQPEAILPPRSSGQDPL
ncbi:MAG TPA: rod shape-determining protein MreC [Sphingomicrobium sp.]|nr:rod shape-determining protein MreC [Sphingomicrobium sp.]